MTFPHLVDATDLEHWADRRDAQADLPRLVRRLVLATADRATRVEFRAGEGIYLSGWDGIVTATGEAPFVPEGLSVWEMGVGPAKQKADEDYTKRTANPGDIDITQTTFVFVTPRRWAGKSNWMRHQRVKGKWKAVVVLDADDLETWLEHAPAVHSWLATLLGKPTNGVHTMKDWWEDWAAATEPVFPPDLLLAGREEAQKSVEQWFAGEASTLAIHADSPDEAAAFIAASVEKQTATVRERIDASMLVVTDANAWSRLCTLDRPLTLVQLFASADAVARATRRGHRVVVPLGRNEPTTDRAVHLPRLRRSGVEEVLKAAGIGEQTAPALAGLARRSIASFRRLCSPIPAVQSPAWAAPAEARALLPALLLGRWQDGAPGDEAALEALAGMSYGAATDLLSRWAGDSDPPVRHVDRTWYLTAPEDAWNLLANSLLRTDVENFIKVASGALGAPDPRYLLSDEEQWTAGMRGLHPPFSADLRSGISETLALMSTRSEAAPAQLHLPARVVTLVRDVLNRANGDWKVWATLGQVLSVLAEAAPDEFLGALQRGLTGDEPPLAAIFRDKTDSVFGSSPHPSIVWALETLAWSGQCLTASALALAGLARIDPGGKLSNRPQHSLRTIFLLWMPQTSCGPAQRLEVIDVLRNREPAAAWQLLLDLLPNGHSSTSPTPRPRWRDWAPAVEYEVTHAELSRGAGCIVERLLDDACQDGTRWAALVEKLQSLDPALQDDVLQRLEVTVANSVGLAEPTKLQDAIRSLVSTHRSYGGADWCLSAKILDRLEAVHAVLEPQDSLARYIWLFQRGVRLMDGTGDEDWKKYEEAVAAARDSAVRTIWQDQGLPGLTDLARMVESADGLGFALGRSDLAHHEEDSLLQSGLAAADSKVADLAYGFAQGRVAKRGATWAIAKLTGVGSHWPAAEQASLLNCLPSCPDTWELAGTLGEDTDLAYWRRVHPFGLSDPDAIALAATKFVGCGRPFTAVDLLAAAGYSKVKLPPLLLLSTVRAALTANAPTEQPANSFRHHVLKLIEIIQTYPDLDDELVAELEWLCMPLFQNSHHRRQRPVRLHAAMGRNPQLFVDALGLCFRGEGADERAPAPTPLQSQLASRAYELLSSWRQIPGTQSDGSIDAGQLTRWIADARALAAACGRSGPGDALIGGMLSSSQRGPDNIWPQPAVCDVFELCQSDGLESGFRSGMLNRRGVVSKAMFEGGGQERALADTYFRDAERLALRWPRTAVAIRRLAEWYRQDAVREDIAAELGQDLRT